MMNFFRLFFFVFFFFSETEHEKRLELPRIWHNLTLITNSAMIKLIWLFLLFSEAQPTWKASWGTMQWSTNPTHRAFVLLFKQVYNFFYTSWTAIFRPHARQIFGFLEYWHKFADSMILRFSSAYQETLSAAPPENETEPSPIVSQTLTPAGAETPARLSENEPVPAAVVPPTLGPAGTSTSKPENFKTTAPSLPVSTPVNQRPTGKEKKAISQCC